MSGISYSASPTSLSLSQHQIKSKNSSSSSSSSIVVPCLFPHKKPCFPSQNLKLKCPQLRGAVERLGVKCRSSSTPGGPPGSGERDGKSVLDAFFLGRALAEVINERIESTVGELLSVAGRLQAEQQKQIQEFQQEDVLERAKRAKDKAAREALEAQGALPKSTTEIAPEAKNIVNGEASPSVVTDVAANISSSLTAANKGNTTVARFNKESFPGNDAK